MENKKKQKKKQEKGISKSNLASKKRPVSARGRIFKGVVVRKFPKRITIQLERTVYIPKYERFLKKNSRIHARLPDEQASEVHVGDIVKIQECRPLSKIVHFIFTEKVKSADENGGKE